MKYLQIKRRERMINNFLENFKKAGRYDLKETPERISKILDDIGL